jgi:plasmid stabilization system protein ParE
MTYRVIVAPEARRLAREYNRWWHANRPKAPELFYTEYQQALEGLKTFPHRGLYYEARSGPARYVLMPRTQYHVYYRVDDTKHTVRVLSVWSAVRGTRPIF